MQAHKHRNSLEQGFTLMEMLIVVTIIGILSSIILPRFVTSSSAAKSAANASEKQTINSQLELFYFTNGSYPTAMTNAGWGGDDNVDPDYKDYWPSGVPTSNVYGQAWTYDPVLGRVE